MWRVFCCKEIQWQNGMREENRKRKKDIFHLEMALNYHLYLVGKSIEIKFRKRVFSFLVWSGLKFFCLLLLLLLEGRFQLIQRVEIQFWMGVRLRGKFKVLSRCKIIISVIVVYHLLDDGWKMQIWVLRIYDTKNYCEDFFNHIF